MSSKHSKSNSNLDLINFNIKKQSKSNHRNINNKRKLKQWKSSRAAKSSKKSSKNSYSSSGADSYDSVFSINSYKEKSSDASMDLKTNFDKINNNDNYGLVSVKYKSIVAPVATSDFSRKLI